MKDQAILPGQLRHDMQWPNFIFYVFAVVDDMCYCYINGAQVRLASTPKFEWYTVKNIKKYTRIIE